MIISVRRHQLPAALANKPAIRLKNRIHCKKSVLGITGSARRDFDKEVDKIVVVLKKLNRKCLQGQVVFRVENGRHSSAGFLEDYVLRAHRKASKTLQEDLKRINRQLQNLATHYSKYGTYAITFTLKQWIDPPVNAALLQQAHAALISHERFSGKWLTRFTLN